MVPAEDEEARYVPTTGLLVMVIIRDTCNLLTLI